MDKLTVVDIDTVTAVLGVTEKTVRTWVNAFGCPSSKDGRSRTFHWPDVLAWYVGYASSKASGVTGDFAPDPTEADEKENISAAMLRKTKAEADLKQMALAKMRGQVIGIEDARRILDRMFGNLKSQLLGSAPLLNTRLEGEPDSISREAAIREFMENLCRELATGKIVRDAEDETNEAETETDEAGYTTIDTIEASADDITDDDVNAVVIEFIAANAELQEMQNAR